MALKTHTIEKKNPQHNQIWEWEETSELLSALEQLRKSTQVVKSYKSTDVKRGGYKCSGRFNSRC